jgi:hypothetical protein
MQAKEKPKTSNAGPAFVRKEKVVPKWNIGDKIPVETTRSQSIPKECVGIVIATGGQVRQLTVHRPIGVTPLSNDDWVITPTGDIKQLLSRQVDPNREKIERARTQVVDEFLIQKGILERDTDSGILYFSGYREKCRKDILKDAHAFQKSNPKGSYLDYVPKAIAEKEELIRELRSTEEFKSFLEVNGPKSTFQTASGPLGERIQLAAAHLQGLTADQIGDALVRATYGLAPVEVHNVSSMGAAAAPGKYAGTTAAPPTTGKTGVSGASSSVMKT